MTSTTFFIIFIPILAILLLAIIAKISIFIFLLELVHYTSKPILDLDFSWTTSLFVNFLVVLTIRFVIPFLCSYIHIDMPSIFDFISIPSQSSSSGSNWDKTHFLAERAKITREMLEVKTDITSTKRDLKEVDKNLQMSGVIKEGQNNALTELKKKFETFFDEDSGNTTKEGLEQIKIELTEDLRIQKREYQGLVIKHGNVVKKLAEFDNSNSQLFFVMRPLHSLVKIPCLISYIRICFSFLMTIFSLGLTVTYVFTDLFIYTPYFIHSIEDFILSFIKYEIVISLPLFIWSSYSICKRYKKYLNVSRGVLDFINTSNYIDLWVLLLIFFIFIPEEQLGIANILALILFNL